MNPPYYSQYGEDKWIVENLNPPDFGFFCEVGAHDGISASNTRHFEEKGWHGVCVEADPFNAAKCILNRKCFTVACAAGLPGLEPFWFTPDDRGLGGLKRNFQTSFYVPVVPLSEILNRVKIHDLDILSIDTEGTELDVWKSLHGLWMPRIVIVEYYTIHMLTDVNEIQDTFIRDGYRLAHKTDCNIIFERNVRLSTT